MIDPNNINLKDKLQDQKFCDTIQKKKHYCHYDLKLKILERKYVSDSSQLDIILTNGQSYSDLVTTSATSHMICL